jgi:RnfABCDGE-type electron transport complex B subunit
MIMSNLMLGAAIMGGLGTFFGTVLAISYRFLNVAEDPRISEVSDLLPGSNCGACGEPGCQRFAAKLVKGAVTPSQCTVSSGESITAIANLLGIEAGQQIKQVARIHCAGGKAQAHQIAVYIGMSSCAAATVVAQGGKGCSWGCLGLADCANACNFNAIVMNANGLPVVKLDQCTACGDCVTACPRDLIEILPVTHHLFVQCKTPLSGSMARDLCSVACDSCGRCAMDAAPDLIRMVDNLPLIDYGAGGPALPEATYRCPTQAIQWLSGAEQFQPPRITAGEQPHG